MWKAFGLCNFAENHLAMKFYFTRLIIFCIAALGAISAKAEVKESLSSIKDSSIVITPIADQLPSGPGPRMPAFIPISASYEATLSTLFLTFTSNLGEIEVTTSSCSPSRQVNGTKANPTSKFLL